MMKGGVCQPAARYLHLLGSSMLAPTALTTAVPL